jgi:hypothetical protein
VAQPSPVAPNGTIIAMAASEHFFCPECNAKLKFGRSPKTRVTCPRCGHQFDFQASPEAIDPFANRIDDAPPTGDADEPIGSNTAFGMVLQELAAVPQAARRDLDFGDEIDEAPPPAEDEEIYGAPPALPKRRAAASGQEQTPKELATKKSRKKRRNRTKLSADALWLYLGAGGILVLLIIVAAVIFRPGAMFGRSLTPAEVAGTYVSEQQPGLKITLRPDGTWGIEDHSQGGDVRIDGLVYSIKGRKILCDAPQEMKSKPRERIFIDSPLPKRNLYEIIAIEFSDLSFKNGTLISPTRGRFTREAESLEEPAAAPVP